MTDYGFLVVARHRDGTLVRGRTADFRPGRSLLSIVNEDGSPIRIAIDDLKALFFVKSLFGDHAHEEKKTFRYRQGVGLKIWVEFNDGEELAGWTVAYDPSKGGFFLFPTDANSNLEKVWVVLRSTRQVLLGDKAIEAALEYEQRNVRGERRRSRPDRWDEMLGLRPQEYRRQTPLPNERGRDSKREPSDIFLGDWE